MTMDGRDPRASGQQWPCYGEHEPMHYRSNKWGVWLHCSRCALRLIYVPKKGAPSDHTEVKNQRDVLKALEMLEADFSSMKGIMPTEEMVRVAIDKHTTNQRYADVLVKCKEKGVVAKKEKGYQTTVSAPKSPSSAAGSWGVLEEPETPTLEQEILKHITTEELVRIKEVMRERAIKAQEDVEMLTTEQLRKLPVEALEMQKDAQRHLAMSAQELLYGDEDALWEFFCAPDSWLSHATEREGLQHMRVNLANDLDLYKPETYEVLANLAVIKQRKMMRIFANWLGQMLGAGYRPDYYHEWPTHCDGWNVQEMEQIQRILVYHGYRIFWCRIDGCRYNLRTRDNKQLLRKQWTIMTTDERFYAMFRNKTCTGGHDHGEIAGGETAATAYYPWNMCRSIARLWRQQEVPDRVLKKLWIKEDLDISNEDYLEVVLHAAEGEDEEPDAVGDEDIEDMREERPDAELVPSEAEKQIWLAKVKKFHKEYVDVVHEEPMEEDEEKVDLPKQPDASTMAPAPMRRLRWKQPRMSPGIPEKEEAVDVNDYQPRSLLVDDDAGMEEDTGLGDGKPLTIGGSSSARPLLQSTSSRASANEVKEPDEKRQKTDHGDVSDESAKDEETLHAELFDALDEVNEGYWLNSYRHIGVDVNVIDQGEQFYVELEQKHYAETLEDLAIEQKRLRSNEEMTPREVSMCRGALGAVQWLAVQSAPLLCARCKLLLSDLSGKPKMEAAKEVQDLIKEARTSTSTSLRFHHFNDVEHWQDMTIVGMADQAHANRPKGESTGGLLVLMGGKSIREGKTSTLSLAGGIQDFQASAILDRKSNEPGM
ncbi:unnamed protein product [Effrenium voratum]|nr:unnamed protein product [Effrenium voratum]